MNYLMMIIASMFICSVTDCMNRYNPNELWNRLKQHIYPITIEQMTIEQRNLALSDQAFSIFKKWDLENIKPTTANLDNIIKFVQYGVSADRQVDVRNESVVRMFTPLYLALLANSVPHAQTLLEKGAQTDVVWSISTRARTDRPFHYSALQVAGQWCDDSGKMQKLIQKYEWEKQKLSFGKGILGDVPDDQ